MLFNATLKVHHKGHPEAITFPSFQGLRIITKISVIWWWNFWNYLGTTDKALDSLFMATFSSPWKTDISFSKSLTSAVLQCCHIFFRASKGGNGAAVVSSVLLLLSPRAVLLLPLLQPSEGQPWTTVHLVTQQVLLFWCCNNNVDYLKGNLGEGYHLHNLMPNMMR